MTSSAPQTATATASNLDATPPAEGSRDAHTEESREPAAERIERAATELFAEHGFGGVGVRDIARVAGVPVSAINYYFGSKEALYRECARKLTQAYVAEATERLQAGAGVDQILEHYLEFGLRNDRLTRMWLDLQLSGDAEAHGYSNREIVGPVWEVLSQAQRADGGVSLDRRLRILSFMGAVMLGAILTDEQIESLTETSSAEARRRWKDDLLHRLGRDRAVERLRLAE